MTIPRLYLDEDIDPLLARILTDRNVDILTTRDAGKLTTTDSE
jgi:predicted nuclease of predicted toxin-antitoxin system